jgi:predicted RNA-binding protein with PUA domain
MLINPEIVVALITNGKMTKEMISALKRTNVALYDILSDEKNRNMICTSLREDLSLLKDARSIYIYLMNKIPLVEWNEEMVMDGEVILYGKRKPEFIDFIRIWRYF